MSDSNAGHAEQYRGKNLLRLLAAICVPAGLLYLRLVLTFAAMDRGVPAAQSAWLLRVAMVVLILFFASQMVGAWYLWSLFPWRPQVWRRVLEFASVFLLGLLFSITGAVMLEAFGYSLFIRAKS